MRISKEETVAEMLVIYEDNTEDGYTSTAGLGLLVEAVEACPPEDRLQVYQMFEHIIGPLEDPNYDGC
jgi:hypothetical protein